MADLPALKAEGSNKRPNVLLGITGSVAAVKGPELALRLSEFANVKVVLTKHGKRFWDLASTYDKDTFRLFCNVEGISMYEDKDEWDVYKVVGQDEVVHIELRRWADVLLIGAGLVALVRVGFPPIAVVACMVIATVGLALI